MLASAKKTGQKSAADQGSQYSPFLVVLCRPTHRVCTVEASVEVSSPEGTENTWEVGSMSGEVGFFCQFTGEAAELRGSCLTNYAVDQLGHWQSIST